LRAIKWEKKKFHLFGKDVVNFLVGLSSQTDEELVQIAGCVKRLHLEEMVKQLD
jgi:hypothetical protein